MTTICGFEVHPAAELFPLIEGADFDALVKDIDENGQMEPIVIDSAGLLIDGRNRARACERLGKEPTRKVYPGNDVVQYVISHNLHRRHLTDSQRAMIAAKLATRPRHRMGAKEVGHMNDLPPTRDQAAELLATSSASIGKARRVLSDGIDELKALVEQGGAPVATAARVATTLTHDEQREYVEKVKAGADPVKAAPPPKDSKRHRKAGDPRPPAPPKYGGNRRKHAQILEAFAVQLSGATQVLDEITELDRSVTAEEAARIRGDLSTSLRSVNRIIQLLKERTE